VPQFELVGHDYCNAEGLVRVAGHEDLSHLVAETQHTLHLLWCDILALLQFEQVLDAVEDPEAPVGLHAGHVSRAEPLAQALVKSVVAPDPALLVLLGCIELLLEDHAAAHHDLPPNDTLLLFEEGVLVVLTLDFAGGLVQLSVVQQLEHNPLHCLPHMA